MASDGIQPGIYNREYFSGSQIGIYIGDVWVDEITSFQFSVGQNKTPLYGYADTHFREVSKGRVLVQGQFSINFKESGYLFLILDRYRRKIKNRKSIMSASFLDGSPEVRDIGFENEAVIERLINGELTAENANTIYAGLAGFSSNARAAAGDLDPVTGKKRRGLGAAEDFFETFEDKIWKKQDSELERDRRADDTLLNPFDIYIGYGDFTKDNRTNHTIQKITDVHILDSQKGFAADGRPIQEVYSFIGRNVI